MFYLILVSDFILSLLASCAKQRPNGAIKKVGLALYSRPRVNHASRPKKITMRIFFFVPDLIFHNWLKCFMKEHSYFCIAHQAVDVFFTKKNNNKFRRKAILVEGQKVVKIILFQKGFSQVVTHWI